MLAQAIGGSRIFQCGIFYVAALADIPADIVAREVAHAKRPHCKTEFLDGVVNLLDRCALVEQEHRLPQILLDHAIADKTIAHPRHHRRLADFFGKFHHGHQYVVRGFFTAYYFQQFHHVRRAEEMHADHVLRALGHLRDAIHIERRGVAGKDGTWFHDAVKFFKYLLLDADVFKHRFDHQIGVAQRLVGERRRQQAQAPSELIGRELALADGVAVVFTDGCDTAIQRILRHFQQRHGDARVEKIHGNATAHGAGTDHGDRFDGSRDGCVRYIGNLGRSTLGEKRVSQGRGLGCRQQFGEEFEFIGEAVVKSHVDRRFDGVDTFVRGGKVIAGDQLSGARGEKLFGVCHVDFQVANAGQFAAGRNDIVGECKCAREKIAVNHSVDGTGFSQHFRFHRLTRDNHFQRQLDACRAWQYTRQPLRAASAG